MTEDQEEMEFELRPARHDRFSILVPALQAAAAGAAALSNMFGTYSMMALQQSLITEYDREFQKITEGFDEHTS